MEIENEVKADLESSASTIDPTSTSSVWIDTDLLLRDVVRGTLAHLLAVLRHRVLRVSSSGFSLGDQIVYAQFNRQHFEPKPELSPDAPEIEKWLAEELDPFDGVTCYRA